MATRPRQTRAASPSPRAVSSRRYHLRVNYGITLEDYEEMLVTQEGKCFLCGRRSRRKLLSVDHDHVTMRVRGLLCQRCNRSLGAFEWNSDVMRRLVEYVEAIIADRFSTDPSDPDGTARKKRRTLPK